jgi:hypothetical protein
MDLKWVARWLLTLITLAVSAKLSSARLLESWPYNKLLKASDLVVIAKATAIKDSTETKVIDSWKVKLIGVNTSFTVRAVLKGKHKGDDLTVLHYRLEEGVALMNGPSLVSFRTGGMSVRTRKGRAGWKESQYLLFLRKRSDGRFEPVSGPIDPELSVREVVPSLGR